MKYIFLFLILNFVTSCKSKTSETIVISLETPEKITKKIKDKTNWHHLDIENDTIPGISWDRYIQEFDINLIDSTIIAVLDTPLEIQNNIISKYSWYNTKETLDGLDNDDNGFIDDKYGWNFLGDTLGNTVLFNRFEYTRMISQNKERLKKTRSLIIEDSVYQKAVKNYDSKLRFASSVVKQTPLFLEQLRKQLRHPALPAMEKDITDSYLDSLIQNKILEEKDISLVIRAKKFDLTLEILAQDSLNYKRHLDYYLNTQYNDRGAIVQYKEDVNQLYHGSNSISSNIDILNHSIKTSGVIALALEKLPKGAGYFKIMPVVISNYGDEHDLDVIAGIRYAVDNGARVINMSSGKSFSTYSEEVLNALKYAAQKDVLFVTSAGNDNNNLDQTAYRDYPNDTDFTGEEEIVPNFLKVGGSNFILNNKLKYTQSNYGLKQVDIFAPGEDITTLFSNEVSGTSYAAPQVSLIAALLFSQYPSLTAPEVKKILMDSSVKYDVLVDVPTKENPEQQLPFSALSKSGGIVNAYNAMLMAEEYVKSKK